MADSKLSDLTASSGVEGTDLFYSDKAAADRKVTGAQLMTFMRTMTLDDATANGVSTVLTLTHTTSGTPANGIGTGIDFVAETAAGNNEIGASIQAVTTDVTDTSEDFDLHLKTMGGGSAASTRLILNVGRNYNIPDSIGIGWNPGVTNGSVLTHFGGGQLLVTDNTGADRASFTNSGLVVGSGGAFGFTSGFSSATSADTLLYRDAAGTLVQRNSTNAQTSRVYNTYTDASNYERLSIGWSSNVATIASEAAGSGTLRPISVLHATANTNTVANILRLTHITSGTPAAGIGTGLSFETETSADNNEIGATIEAVTTDVTATSEDFDIVFKTMAAGAAAAERLRIASTGNIVLNDTGIARNAAGVIEINSGTIGTFRDIRVRNAIDDNGTIYSNIPQNSQSAAYTLVLGDANKHIFHPSADTTARTWTIPANSSVAYPIGTAVTFINQNAAGVITISITTDTLRLAGAGTTGNRSLAANGVATAIKVTSTEWIISGTGLT